jgi:hypothetical protein
MHVEGESRHRLAPEETYAGKSLFRHCISIKKLIDRFGASSILDYGSGKGLQYRAAKVKLGDGREYASIPEFWGLAVTCYDPGYEPFSRLPSGKYDGVISTDVLEHCPETDIPWILAEMFSFARRFVFANVACYPAQKHLANGENAHCTIKGPEWWQESVGRAAMAAPEVRFFFQLEQVVHRPDGGRELSPVILEG